MPPSQVSPPARWLLALGGLIGVIAIVFLLGSMSGRGTKPGAVDAGVRSSQAAGPRQAPPPDVASRPRAGVAGHVLDTAKAPVAGAAVCAWAGRGTGLTTAQTRVPRCAVSDAKGEYTLTDLFSATPLTLTAGAAGFPPRAHRGADGSDVVRLAEGEQRTGVDFELIGGGVEIRGRVNDATGGVVPGALVASEALEVSGRAIATTDGKGEFSLWVEPGQVRLGATATGYAPGRVAGPAPGHFFSLYLVPGATLVGRAVVAGGETPVVGALIDAIPVEAGGPRGSTRSDEEGRFRVEGLVPGRYRIEATAEGREGYSRASITLAMGETSGEIIVELDPAYVVRGRITEKGSGEPCKAGSVTITDRKQNEFSQAKIDPDGWARMASVIPGNYEVEVACEGHVSRDDYPAITVKDQDAPEQRWEVDRGASVRISVTDGEGKQVVRGGASAHPRETGSGAFADHAEADGTFLITGLKAGAYGITFRSPDGTRASEEVTVEGTREERIKIQLPLAGVIDGVVEDDLHRPVANVTVTASGPHRASARSLDDGTFTLSGLPSGDYVLTSVERGRRRGADGDDKRPEVKVVVTAPGHVKARVTVERRDGVIEGRVVDGSGQPVTDAFIDSARAVGSSTNVPRFGGGDRAPVVTDTEGHFKIEGLEAGEYNIRAHRKGGGEASSDHVAVGRRDVSLRLADGASLAGNLTSPSGPVERFMFRVAEKKSSFRRGEYFFHAAGAFVLRDLPAGDYEVVAETPSGAATAELTLKEGEQKTDLQLKLTLRGVVEGRLVALEGGAPVPGMRVTVDGSAGSVSVSEGYRSSTTGADGRFKIEGVLGGKWSLQASPVDRAGRFESMSIPVEVGGGGATDVGSIRVARSRLEPGEMPGDLGLAVRFGGGEGAQPLEIMAVSGAAAEAGITAGDVIVSVDGFDVSGSNRYLFSPLVQVAAGRTVSFGLGRGGAISVTARGAPRDAEE
jgi:protocatechuate 3,4-dioxygenase beta subunit